MKYSHFVPMGDSSPSIKKPLEIPETDIASLKPIEGYQEIIKEEKYVNQDTTPPPTKVFEPKFKNSPPDSSAMSRKIGKVW